VEAVGLRLGVVDTTLGAAGTSSLLSDKTTAGATDAAIMTASPKTMPICTPSDAFATPLTMLPTTPGDPAAAAEAALAVALAATDAADAALLAA